MCVRLSAFIKRLQEIQEKNNTYDPIVWKTVVENGVVVDYFPARIEEGHLQDGVHSDHTKPAVIIG